MFLDYKENFDAVIVKYTDLANDNRELEATLAKAKEALIEERAITIAFAPGYIAPNEYISHIKTARDQLMQEYDWFKEC